MVIDFFFQFCFEIDFSINSFLKIVFNFSILYCADKSKLSQSVSMTSFDNRRSLLISEDDDFSDDSLENGAIPVNHVPRAFEGSASATDLPKTLAAELQPFGLSPSKCNPGIAWEIKMDGIDDVERLAKVVYALCLNIRQ